MLQIGLIGYNRQFILVNLHKILDRIDPQEEIIYRSDSKIITKTAVYFILDRLTSIHGLRLDQIFICTDWKKRVYELHKKEVDHLLLAVHSSCVPVEFQVQEIILE